MKNFIDIGKTEEEQVEQIKQWVKENGMQIIIGIALGLSALWGWGYYQDRQHKQAIDARSSYLSVVASADNANALTNLQNNHANSSYAQQGTLMAAKHALDSGNQQQALDYLSPLMTVDNKFIAHTAKLRSASIYLEMHQYQQALARLDDIQSNAFGGLYSNLKGDIYFAQNNKALAKEHYQLALAQLPADSKLKALIQIKLDDLN